MTSENADELPRPLTEDEVMEAETIVWVGELACGCRPLSVVDTVGPMPAADVDMLFELLLAQSKRVEAYSVEAAAQVVKPCSHGGGPVFSGRAS